MRRLCADQISAAFAVLLLTLIAVPAFGGSPAPAPAAGRGRGRGVAVPPPSAAQPVFGGPAAAPAPVAAPPAGRGRGRGVSPMAAPPVGQPAQPYQVVVQRAAGGLGMVINSTVCCRALVGIFRTIPLLKLGREHCVWAARFDGS